MAVEAISLSGAPAGAAEGGAELEVDIEPEGGIEVNRHRTATEINRIEPESGIEIERGEVAASQARAWPMRPGNRAPAAAAPDPRSARSTA